MTIDIPRLRALAQAATPGPWQRSGTRTKLREEDCIGVGPDGACIAFLPIGQPRQHAEAFCDAAFIAAASPGVLLALLDERDRLREALHQIAWPGQRRPIVPEGPVHEVAIMLAHEALGEPTP